MYQIEPQQLWNRNKYLLVGWNVELRTSFTMWKAIWCTSGWICSKLALFWDGSNWSTNRLFSQWKIKKSQQVNYKPSLTVSVLSIEQTIDNVLWRHNTHTLNKHICPWLIVWALYKEMLHSCYNSKMRQMQISIWLLSMYFYVSVTLENLHPSSCLKILGHSPDKLVLLMILLFAGFK